MEDTDIRSHSGIPLGHKFFAVLLGAAVAAAGCAWLLYQSRKSASAAVLAFHPALAQHIDPGIASAKDPAVVLADSALNDQMVAGLAKQAHLAATTPAGEVGEFRSNLQLSQTSGGRLDVRYRAADPSQALAEANAVARTLAAWNPAQSATPAALGTQSPAAPPAQQPAPVNQGQAHPAAAAASAAQSTRTDHAPPDHPLSEALRRLGAQLSATDRRLDQPAAGGASSSGGEGSSYSESAQQSLIRTEVGDAQRTLRDFRTRYAREVADPNIAARVDEIQQAIGSILAGGHRHGFNAAGVSTWELSAERSELRQTIHIVSEETKRVQLAEAAHPASLPQASAPANPPPPATTASAASPAPSPAVQSSSSGIQEENIPATAPASQAAQDSSTNPLSIVRLAAPAPRPPLWPAIVAGAICCLVYFGIAAIAYRRTGSGDLEADISSAPQRMITFSDPVRVDEPPGTPPEPSHVEAAQRQRASFVFVPAPASAQETSAAVETPVTVAENSPAADTIPAAAVENADLAAQEAHPAFPNEAAGSLSEPGVEAVENTAPAAETETAPDPALGSGKEVGSPVSERVELHAEHRLYVSPREPAAGADPVADRIRKSLTETSVARSLQHLDERDRRNGTPGQDQPAESSDPQVDSPSPPDK